MSCFRIACRVAAGIYFVVVLLAVLWDSGSEIAALKERVLQGRARLEDDVAQIIAQRREIQAERDALFAPLADDLKEAYERARSHGGYAVMGMRPDGSTGAGVRFSPLEVARIRALPDDALYVSEDYDCIVVRLEG